MPTDEQLTNERANEIYNDAVAALHKVVTGTDATEEQRKIAGEKRDQLTRNFIDQAIASIKARTARFQAFIDEMNAVIAEFDPSTTVAGILQLKAVVDDAGTLIAAATGTRAVPAQRALRAKRPAKAPKKVPRRRAPVSSASRLAAKRRSKKPSQATRAAAPGKSARKAKRPPRKTSRKKGH